VNKLKLEEIEEFSKKLEKILGLLESKSIIKKEAILQIIDLYNSIDLNFFYSIEELNKFKKGIYYLIGIDSKSIEIFKFLESIIIENSISRYFRSFILELLEIYFPKKAKQIKQYLIIHDFYYVHGINKKYDISNKKNISTGLDIIKVELHNFLLKLADILNSYSPKYYGVFSYNYEYKGLSNSFCLIVHKNHDPFKFKQYSLKYTIKQCKSLKKIIARFYSNINNRFLNAEGFYINDKYFLRTHLLNLSIKLIKNYKDNIKENETIIYLPKNNNNPIKIFNNKTDIVIYFFPEKVFSSKDKNGQLKITVNLRAHYSETKLSKLQKTILKYLYKKWQGLPYYDLNEKIFLLNNQNTNIQYNTKLSLSLAEKEIENFIKTNLNLIENELTLIETQKRTPFGIIDILAKDKENNIVVIEIKKGKATDNTIGQLLRYLSWAKQNYDKKIRGIIISNTKSKILDMILEEINYSIKIKYLKHIIPFSMYEKTRGIPKEILPNSHKAKFSRCIKRLENRNLITYNNKKIKLTDKGTDICKSILIEN